jgi:hypothetical protein
LVVKSHDKVAHEVMHSAGRFVEPQEWHFTNHEEEVSRHVIFVASRGVCRDAVHLEPSTWVGATVVFFDGWLEVLGVSDRLEATRERWEVVDCSRAS